MSRRDLAFLVMRAQSGDEKALDDLLRQFQEPLFRCIHHIVGERSLAEDVLQEVFVIIYRKLIWLREPTVFSAWAYRIASREALARLRREQRWLTATDDEALESVADPATPDAERRRLAARLPQLVSQVSPASRAVLVLHYIEDLALPEVADVLGLSLGTVKSRLAYGLRQLRRRLTGDVDEAGPANEAG